MRYVSLVRLILLIVLATGFAVPASGKTLTPADLVSQFKSAGNDPQKLALTTENIARNPAAIDAVMASGNLRLIKKYQEQAALLYSRDAEAAQKPMTDAEGLVNNYWESVRLKSPEEQQKALRELAQNKVALRLLIRSGKMTAAATEALIASVGAQPVLKSAPATVLSLDDLVMDQEYTRKLNEAKGLVDDLQRAIDAGDDVAQKAATMRILDNREARLLMRDGPFDEALKTSYGQLAKTHRTDPIRAGTAEMLNRSDFVVIVNGVERPVTADDFKIGSKDPNKPGMDLDFYKDPDVKIINKSTGNLVEREDIERAMQTTAADQGIDYHKQEINVTGMGSKEDLPLRPGETPADMMERIKNDKDLTPKEREKILEVIQHKLDEANLRYADDTLSSSLQHRAYVLRKEKSRFFDPMIVDRPGPDMPEIYLRKDPRTGETAWEVIEKLADGKIPPGTANARFREITGGIEIDEAINQIDDWGKVMAKSSEPPSLAWRLTHSLKKQAEMLQNSKVSAVLKGQWDALKNSQVGTVFRDQINNIKNSKIPFGKGFQYFGDALGGISTAGDFARFMAEERDRSIQTGDVNSNESLYYALMRTGETATLEPLRMARDLAAAGLDKGAEALYDWKQKLIKRANEAGYLQAFGEGMYDLVTSPVALPSAVAGWASVQAEAAAGAVWDGLSYAASNPFESSVKIGEFLGLQAIGDVLFTDTGTLWANAEAQRNQLRDSATDLGIRADQLKQIVDEFKKIVRTGDPEDKSYVQDMKDLVPIYEKRYTQLMKDYWRWQSMMNRTFGGIENPLVAAVWRDVRVPLEKVNALPESLMDVLSPEFIKGLLSTLSIRVRDAESGDFISADGSVQFNGNGIEMVCRNEEANLSCSGKSGGISCNAPWPNFDCQNIPPGKLQVSIRAGDYEGSQRTFTVDPLARRNYLLTFGLATEIPPWARITVNVVDVETQAPIPGAFIRFNSNAEKARETTTTTGAVQVNQVLNGDVTIRASAAGYHANQSSLHIDTTQDTEYSLLLALQPDGSAKKKPEPEKPKPASGSFDCSQLQITTNINFSSWSCCKDDIEREMAASMCRGLERQASSQKWQIQMKITEAIRTQEGDSYNSRADYSDYPTPYGTLREVDQCASSQVDDLCRKLGAPRSGKPPEKKEEPKKDDAKQRKAEACFESKREMIENAKKANSDGDGGNFLIYASKACQDAHKKCEDDVFNAGVACRAKATTNEALKACNNKVTLGWEKCALAEVNCSEGAIKQQCGYEK